MSNKNWQSIITEWVNCLQLINPIIRYEDLRNGNFLDILMKNLIHEEADAYINPFKCATVFLKKYYCCFDFSYDCSIGENIKDIELLEIISLLLHYTCIYDKREMFTSPLCRLLSSNAQLSVKKFLESVDENIRKEELFQIISQCYCDKSPEVLQQRNHKKCTALGSPLQIFLQKSNYNVLEKEAEIKKLQMKVTIEKQQIIELQEDLKTEQDINKTLSKQLQDKLTEILKLKNKIDDLESQLSLTCESQKCCQLQEELQNQNKMLNEDNEYYKMEQDKLYELHQSISDKLTKAEDKILKLTNQIKLLEDDQICLNHEIEEQMYLNNTLSIQNKEYLQIITEQNTFKNDDLNLSDSHEKSFSVPENAGCVIELQLKDIEKEKLELENRLSEMKTNFEEKHKESEVKFNSYVRSEKALKNTINTLEVQLRTKTDELALLNQKLLNLSNNQEELQNQLNNSNVEINLLKHLNEEQLKTENEYKITLQNNKQTEDFLKQRINDFEMELNNTSKRLLEVMESENLLQHCEENQKATIQDLNKQLLISKDEISNLLNYQTIVDQEKISMQNTFQKTLHDLIISNVLKEQEFGIILRHLNTYEKNLNKTIFTLKEQLNIKTTDNNVLKKTIKRLSNKHRQSDKLFLQTQNNQQAHFDYEKIKMKDDFKKVLNETYIEYNAKIAVWEEKLRYTTETEKKLNLAINDLNEQLTAKDKALLNANQYIADFKQNIYLLKTENEITLNNTIKQKTEVEKTLTLKIDQLDKLLSIKNNNEISLNHIINNYEEQLCFKQHELTVAHDTLLNLQLKLEDVNKDLCVLQQIQNEVCIMKKIEQESKEHLKMLEEQKQKLEQELLTKQKNEDNLNKTIQALNSQLSLKHQGIIMLQSNKENLIEQLKELKQEFETFKNEFNTTLRELEDSFSELQYELSVNLKSSSETLRDMESQLEIRKEKIETLEKNCKENDTIFSTFTDDLKGKQEYINELNETIMSQTKLIEPLKEDCLNLKQQYSKAQLIIKNLEDHNSALKQEKLMLKNKSEDLQDILQNIVTEIGSKNEELHNIININSKGELPLNVTNTTKLPESELIDIVVCKSKNELESLEENIAKIRNTLELFDNRENTYMKRLRDAKEELDNTILRYSASLEEHHETNNDNEIQINSLTENLHVMVEKYNILTLTNNENVEKLDNALKQINALQENYKCNFENLKEQLNAVVLENTKLQDENAFLQIELKNCTIEKLELDTLQNEKQAVVVSLENVLLEEEKNHKMKLEDMESKIIRIQLENKTLNDNVQMFKKQVEDLLLTVENLNLELKQSENNLRQEEEESSKILNQIVAEKNELITRYNDTCAEKIKIEQELNILKTGKTETNLELQQQIERHLIVCKEYTNIANCYKVNLEKLLLEKNILENLLSDLKQNLMSAQVKCLSIIDDREHIKMKEQIESFKTIIDDSNKQYIKFSKIISNFIIAFVEIPTKFQTVLTAQDDIKMESIENMNIENELEKITDCKNALTDLQNKITTFIYTLTMKATKPQKENVLKSLNSDIKMDNEDIKKRNIHLKQRLTLSDYAKGNLERKVKELRQEIKQLKDGTTIINPNTGSKDDVNLNIAIKENYEKELSKIKSKCTLLEQEKSMMHKKFTEDYEKLQNEHEKLQSAYGNVVSDKYKLDLEKTTLKKVIESRSNHLEVITKDYNDLLEMNNKLKIDMDTLNYKQKRCQNDYETKLENMKQKMVEIYKKELSTELLKYKTVKIEPTKSNKQLLDEYKNSVTSRKAGDGKYATVGRFSGMTAIAENVMLSANSVPQAIGHNLEMEDEEEDLFNNKYLEDLKAGRCISPSGRESTSSRLSELKWRNSLCPPHLKSSYPAETQFHSPNKFKDDELKLGTISFDDSLNTQLIPNEKRRKDVGTTSYKKPGPPTPSKNGGRLSLQGNENRPQRQTHDSKTPKRLTPSRLRALFTGRKDSSLVGGVETPKRRLSIFRKGK